MTMGEPSPDDFQREESEEVEVHVSVDIPDMYMIRTGQKGYTQTLEEFKTENEALAWAKEWLGADENGMIYVISTF